MRSRDARPDGGSTRLVLDGRIVDSVESLRPMAWVVLEAVALAAAVEDQALVAHTSARQVAQCWASIPELLPPLSASCASGASSSSAGPEAKPGDSACPPTSSATSPPSGFVHV